MRRGYARLLLLALLLVIGMAACGQPDPAATAIVAGSNVATPAGTAAATLPANSAEIRTADEAVAAAAALGMRADKLQIIRVERITLSEAYDVMQDFNGNSGGTPPYELWADHRDDPHWWVQGTGDHFQYAMSCPASINPQGTPAGCPSWPDAEMGMIIASVPGPHAGNGVAIQGRQSPRIPDDATLRTWQDAMAAAQWEVPGKNGNKASVVGVRLLTWAEEQAAGEAMGMRRFLPLAPDALLWQVELTDANFNPPCTVIGGCPWTDVTVIFDALTGANLGYRSPSPGHVATPAPAARGTPVSPAATPTPSVTIGVPQAAKERLNLTITPTSEPPLISLDAALQLVQERGVPWALGGTWQGKPVTIAAEYGIAERQGSEQDTTHPVWIIDYGNTVFYNSGGPPANHSLYLIDAQTRRILRVTGYGGTE